MITERTTIGKIEILEDGQIQIRKDTVIERNGVEVTRTFFRQVLDPALPFDATQFNDPRIARIVNVLWTPDVIAARVKRRADAAEAAATV